MIRSRIRLCLSCVQSARLGLPVLSGLLLFVSVAAQAQFNGPSSLGTTEINRPITFTTDPAILFPPSQDVVLGFGDIIEIRLLADSEYTVSVRISSDGSVQLPLIGLTHLAGLTVTQAEQLIAEKMVDAQMYRDPQVILRIAEGPNSVATLIGEVHGAIPVVGSRRLLDVLSVAGGLPPTASHVITINRPGVKDPIVVDLGSDPLASQLGNIPIFPGDTIVVARVGNVYVLGSFKGTGGIVPLNAYTPLTLTEVTALSGGVQFDGRFKDLRIIRTVGNRRTVAVYDIKAVLNGKAPDPILQPNDIVYLPPVPFKTLLSSGALGTVLGITSLAISIADR